MLHVAFIRGFMIKIYQTSMFKLGLLCLTVDAFFFIHRAWKLSRNCLITDMFLTVCCIFRATAGLRCCWCDRYPRSDSAAVWSSSPGFSGGCFESRSAGTTRGEGIKENMSDKHNQQPLTSPFICLRSSTEEKGKESSGFGVSAGSISQDLARPMTMNSWC